MNNAPIDLKPLKQFCIEYKMKALENERRLTGVSKEMVSVQVRTIEAFLICLSTQMREEDMGTLKLRLDSAPVPTSQVRARSPIDDELRSFLIEAAEKVPAGNSLKIAELGDLTADKVASKMWSLRERGMLPKHIVPLLKTDKQTNRREIYISHKTDEELQRMRKGRKGGRS